MKIKPRRLLAIAFIAIPIGLVLAVLLANPPAILGVLAGFFCVGMIAGLVIALDEFFGGY